MKHNCQKFDKCYQKFTSMLTFYRKFITNHVNEKFKYVNRAYIQCDRNYFNGVDVVVWVIERVSQLYKPAVAIYECYAVWICVNLCDLSKVAASIIAETDTDTPSPCFCVLVIPV